MLSLLFIANSSQILPSSGDNLKGVFEFWLTTEADKKRNLEKEVACQAARHAQLAAEEIAAQAKLDTEIDANIGKEIYSSVESRRMPDGRVLRPYSQSHRLLKILNINDLKLENGKIVNNHILEEIINNLILFDSDSKTPDSEEKFQKTEERLRSLIHCLQTKK